LIPSYKNDTKASFYCKLVGFVVERHITTSPKAQKVLNHIYFLLYSLLKYSLLLASSFTVVL